ncbi:unnamed protein product [Cyclocybe aegerita]|uniref:Crinkler effector protein N-terminal domain-containing protein n=1 Tax=Cyclocybe aegerita TaxID=1973307 RepID=A0A8S0W392_CYCAE|nr:unnamed protein product [Cyclocybe aegerita]
MDHRLDIYVLHLQLLLTSIMSTIAINCLISGDDPDKIFTVEISSNKNVSILKDIIKGKKQALSSIDAMEIRLFKVSLSDADLEQARDPRKIDAAQELSSPLAEISAIFKDLPKDKVHVIALAPTGTGNHQRPPSLSPELRKELEAAWTQEYQGSTHQTLLSNIQSDPRGSPYCNTGAIIQSSGYGKSRTVDELAKLVFTIPMNLRAEAETQQGAYPLPDTCIAKSILSMAKATSDDDVVTMFHMLFCTLFQRIVAELNSIDWASDIQAKDFATQWRKHLLEGGVRSELYSSVIRDVEPRFRMDLPSSAKSDAVTALQELIRRIPVAKGKAPLVVMYVDEAHELDVRAINSSRNLTLYDLFTTAVSEYPEGFFVLFLSTVSRMRQLAPRTKLTRSNRSVVTGDLIPPYTEMPFDCHPSLPVSSLGDLTLKDVQDFSFIARFGRPLFWSMLEAARQSSPKSPPHAKIRIFALQKLTNSAHISDLNSHAKLAILDTILNLEFYPFRAQTVSLMEDLISSHMRTAYSAPIHREYLHTGYPSEPVLAEAAMQALYLTESASKRDQDAAAEFFSSLDGGNTKGAIDMGQRGENVAKMILVRAYMTAVKAADMQYYGNPNWSSGCSLVTFLKSLTGRKFQELVLDCKPNNLLASEGQPLKEAFARSWVRFTHFGRAADDGAVTTSAACAAFVRAMSFIGWSSQKSVDVCIPILLDIDKPITEANMSSILVQIKLRSKKGSYEVDAKKIGLFPPPGSSRDCMKTKMGVESEKYFSRPYISLVMELGVGKLRDTKSAFVQEHLDQNSVSTSNKVSPPRIGIVAHQPLTRITSRATPKAIHPRYSLCFYGCTAEVYGCIHEAAESIYELLLQLSDMVPDHPRPSSISMVLRMKPFWRTNNESYDWFNDSWLRADENEVEEDAVIEEEEEDMVLEKVQEHVPTRSEDEKQNSAMVVD